MVIKECDYKAKLVNGLPVLYCRFGKNTPWINISNKRFSIKHFSFSDPENHTHSINECEITIEGLVAKFSFPFDVDKILYQNRVVLKTCDRFWSGNPKYILFELAKNEFTIGFSHGVERKVDSKVEYGGRQYGGELDIDKSENKKPESGIFMYTFHTKPKGIKYEGEVVWESLPGEALPDRMLRDEETDEIVVFFQDKYLVSRKEDGIRTSDVHEFTQSHREILNSYFHNSFRST
ncbi:hypothetical protein TpMuguga_03g00229 [Theileria parva strain Muguga]|uniref:Uncharacterized protein n=1 Tax=Theileria parva TaxID=5875 RepID=Q4N0C0_THEPA|nr:uncharacterized protein TpMuguga_03g00229 [Theileria parva strain Muguga]EAN30964.1 hypothetical protein TpMuguga_03g00229 [Theileria parva strain Muguga]|eukprot:XP_763247.1 hypothetical protein [Theileria parva strain Muguga]